MASIREVAAEANVSLGTVSKVLNNSANAQIAPATRVRVLEAAKRIGYHPSVVARGLAGKRMDTVGLVMAYDQVTVTGDPYLGPCLDGILEVNKRHRQKTVVFAEDSWTEARKHLRSYCDGNCDGLMLIIPRLDSAIIDDLRERASTFILVGDSRDDSSLVAVDVDNVLAARDLTHYLMAQGHRRIAAFCGYDDFCSSHQRLAGFRQAFVEANLPVNPEWIFPGAYRGASGAENMHLLLTRFPEPHTRPTAVFCFSDSIALGALETCAKEGVAVPEDLSVVGFDDTPATAFAHPALTTMRQPIRAVGVKAAETLLALLNGQVTAGERVYVPTELVVRRSVAPPKYS